MKASVAFLVLGVLPSKKWPIAQSSRKKGILINHWGFWFHFKYFNELFYVSNEQDKIRAISIQSCDVDLVLSALHRVWIFLFFFISKEEIYIIRDFRWEKDKNDI